MLELKNTALAALNENKAKASGIREFVIKPIVRDEIARIIRKVLDE